MVNKTKPELTWIGKENRPRLEPEKRWKWYSSNYPPAKPGALRLLAPQRGLIAIGKQKENPNSMDRIDIRFSFPGTNVG
jgi:hypothetical protein